MSTELKVECDFHFAKRGKRKAIEPGVAPTPPAPGRVPRVAKLMALAIRLESLVRAGTVANYAAVARLGHVTNARVSQIMSLLNLAPDIQEALLFLPRTLRGRAPIILKDLLPIVTEPDWKRQRRRWAELTAKVASR
jgi:hypothetical protein